MIIDHGFTNREQRDFYSIAQREKDTDAVKHAVLPLKTLLEAFPASVRFSSRRNETQKNSITKEKLQYFY